MRNFNKLVNESVAQLEQLIVTRYNKRMQYCYKQRMSKTNSVIVFPIHIAVPFACKHHGKNYRGVLFTHQFLKINRYRIHVETVSF